MNTHYIAGFLVTDELYHHGIKGQKWGIRRFQNEDGSYTEEGLKRYRRKDSRADLGYTRFQRINNVQSGFVDRYKDNIKDYMRNTKIAKRTKRESKKNEYIAEAKAFMNKSEITKSMNTYYNSLTKREKNSLNDEYKSRLLDIGREAAHDYIDKELLKIKVSTDRQKDIWDRT